MKRNLYDDFLDQLKPSTNDKQQGQRFVSGKFLGEGLTNKAFCLADVSVPMTGLEMFKLWYGQRNLHSPLSSPQQYDLGKLLVSSVFMDVDILNVVANRYDPVSRVIRGNEGEILLTIRREEFQEVFDLYEPYASLV